MPVNQHLCCKVCSIVTVYSHDRKCEIYFNTAAISPCQQMKLKPLLYLRRTTNNLWIRRIYQKTKICRPQYISLASCKVTYKWLFIIDLSVISHNKCVMMCTKIRHAFYIAPIENKEIPKSPPVAKALNRKLITSKYYGMKGRNHHPRWD